VPQTLEAWIGIPAREKQWLLAIPDCTKDSVARFYSMESQITLQGQRRIQTLLRDVRRYFNQWGTIFRNEAGNQQLAGPIHQVKSASMRICNAGCSFDDQPVEIRRAQVIRKRFTQTMQKVENPVFFNLQFFSCPPELLDNPTLFVNYSDQGEDTGGE
jgi:hypothetical protein